MISIILPDNENPTDGIIVEFSAGVGGQEAMLFCGELLEMYCNYCENRGFEYTLTQFEKSDLEGVRHATINIEHPGVKHQELTLLFHIVIYYLYF